jgi:hypothetical protein
LVCPDIYVDMLAELVTAEHCKVLIEPHESGRTSLWISYGPKNPSC